MSPFGENSVADDIGSDVWNISLVRLLRRWILAAFVSKLQSGDRRDGLSMIRKQLLGFAGAMAALLVIFFVYECSAQFSSRIIGHSTSSLQQVKLGHCTPFRRGHLVSSKTCCLKRGTDGFVFFHGLVQE